MNKFAICLFVIFCPFTQAAESTFSWKGTVPAATTYINKTVVYNDNFQIEKYASLSYINYDLDKNRSIKLIALTDM